MRSIRILLVTLLLACPAAAATSERTLLVFGDSLSAAYGLRADQGWVAHMQKRIAAQGYVYRVVNASVSGETTSGGRNRLDRALSQNHPQLVILELGANDGLRGLPLKSMQDNLAAMVGTIQHSGAAVLLLGIFIPPNYGASYTQGFSGVFESVAREKKIPHVPFILQGIALDARYMQADGLHPNAIGQPLVLDNIWPWLQPLLKR